MAAFPDDDLTDDDDFPELSFMGAVLVLCAGLLFEMLFIAGSAYVCNWTYERHFLPLTGYPLTYSTFVAVQVVYRLITFRGVGSSGPEDRDWRKALVAQFLGVLIPWIWFLVVWVLLG